MLVIKNAFLSCPTPLIKCTLCPLQPQTVRNGFKPPIKSNYFLPLISPVLKLYLWGGAMTLQQMRCHNKVGYNSAGSLWVTALEELNAYVTMRGNCAALQIDGAHCKPLMV